ncbi:MAG TPA: hypothetical protein VN607_04575 [Gemmatimonadaceae bacterium]|nr:hypothetical protein [Gemmatimonadaceae bacterium]
MTHLTEAERQSVADGGAPADRAAIDEHLAACRECAADVARLASVVQHLRELPPPNEQPDALWPDVRARIEHGASLGVPAPGVFRRVARRPAAWFAAALAVAACAIVMVHPWSRTTVRFPTRPNGPAAFQPAGDSTGTSPEEIQRLLDEIQMEKAMLPPATAAVADSDLRAIDSALAELREALARDPNNPAIRQLLAASYRQQRDLLARLHNAS